MFRQLGFGLLDMEWHTLTSPVNIDVTQFEDSAIKKIELFPKTPDLNISCSFSHIFGGGYAAGYYGYKWAEVLDADAFEYFSKKGIFNAKTSESFRRNILEKGASEKPMKLYIKFRGKKPSIKSLLKRSGLK
jgi:peptidyl-dipeptidase Dcp